MRAAALGDLVGPIKSWNPASEPEETFNYVDLSAISQADKRIMSANSLQGAEAPSRARQIISAGDILVSTVRPNLNGVAPVTPEYDGATASTGFCVLRPNALKIVSRYLMHWVQSPTFVEQMVRQATGASYPAVSDKIVKASMIPLPPLDEQRRIAAILDKVDALRRLRRRVVDLSAQVPQSLFVQMFGAAEANPKRWKSVALSEVCEIASGLTKGRKEPIGALRCVPYLAVANVQDHALDLLAVKSIEASEEEIARLRLRNGDLVLTEGGDPDKLGRGTIWRDELPEVIHQNHIFRVRPDRREVNPTYLNYLIGSRYGKRYFLRSAKQTTGIASINKTQLSEFPVLAPPLALQEQFEAEISRLAKARCRGIEALNTTNSLFASLQHRTFTRGL